MSKRFGPLAFKGSTQEKSLSEIFRFGYGKAANDKKVPNRVGSGVSVLHLIISDSLGHIRRDQIGACVRVFRSKRFLCEAEGALLDDDRAFHLRMKGAVILKAPGLGKRVAPGSSGIDGT